MGFQLRSYQIGAIDFISKHQGVGLLCMPPGSGKTATALYLRKMYPALKKILIICPASIKEQWKQNVLSIFPDESVFVIYGKYNQDYIQNIVEANIVIVNYDILFSKVSKKAKTTVNQEISWKDLLKRVKWDLGVIDESHFCASYNSARTQAVREIFEYTLHKVMLTGTPLLSSVDSLFAQFNILHPMKWYSHKYFINRYCPPASKKQKEENPAQSFVLQNLDELKILMSECCYVVSKEEVYSHLPDVTETLVPCVIKKNTELNKQIEKLKQTIEDSTNQLEIENMINSSRQILGKAKIRFCVDYVNDMLCMDTDTKIVVFTHHREVTEETANLFGDKAVLFYGGMSANQKQAALDRFLNDDKCRVIVMNSSAVTGVDSIQKKANTCVWLELTSSSYIEEQATGRIRRINSGKWFDKFFSYFIKSDSPLDDAILAVLEDRRNLVKAVLSGNQISNEERSDALEILRKLKGQ